MRITQPQVYHIYINGNKVKRMTFNPEEVNKVQILDAILEEEKVKQTLRHGEYESLNLKQDDDNEFHVYFISKTIIVK